MDFFDTSKVFSTAVLLLSTATTNVQPITATFTATKDFTDLNIPVREIIMENTLLNMVSDISDWVPQLVGSEMDDDDFNSECLTEATACADDSVCNDCASMTVDSDCDISSLTCSSMMDAMCCTYGDSCGNNTALVAFVDCTVEAYGCHVDDDLCDTEDDNGTLAAPDDTECPDELTACFENTDCLACFEGLEVDDDACSNDAIECDDVADTMCCLVGGATSGCGENGLLLNFVNCIVDDTGCYVDDDLCDTEDDNGTRDLPLDEDCPDELTACFEDMSCLACFAGVRDDDDACSDDLTDCDDVADFACCYFGETSGCSENSLLLDYINCNAEQVVSTGCSIADICGFDDSGATKPAGWSSEAAIFVATATGLLFAVVDRLL